MNEQELLKIIKQEIQPEIAESFDYTGGVVVLPSADPVIIKGQ